MITQKVFTDKLEDRIDPFYYKPTFMKRYQEINGSKYKKVALEDVITDLKNGVEIRQYSNKGFRYLRVTDLDEFGINDNSPRLVDVEEIPPRVKLTKRDILISRSGSLGLLTAVKDKDLDSIISSHIFKVRLDTNKILPEYLELYLRSKFGQFQFFQKNNGGIVPEINQSALKSITVILPPLDIQKKLIEQIKLSYQQRKEKLKQADEILNSIDDFVRQQLGIDHQESEEETVYTVNSEDLENNRLDPYYFKPNFISLERILLVNKAVKLGELIKSITNGLDYRKFSEDGTLDYLRVSNIKPHKIDYTEVKKVKLIRSDINKSIFGAKDDILLTRKGTYGISVSLEEDLNAIISSEIFLLKVYAEKVNPQYLSIFLNSSLGQKQFLRNKVGAIMGSLSQEAVKDTIIVVPSEGMQASIVNQVKSQIRKSNELKQEAELIITKAKKHVEVMILN